MNKINIKEKEDMSSGQDGENLEKKYKKYYNNTSS